MIQHTGIEEITVEIEGSGWYAIHAAPGGLSLRHVEWERSSNRVDARLRASGPLGFPTEEALKRRGFNPFVPVESIFIRQNRYHAAQKRRVRRAIIPGMLFLHLVEPVNWFALREIPTVSGVFGLHGVPYRFRPADIARLIAISETMKMPEYFKPMPTRRVYEVGDDVVDLAGRFEAPLRVIEIRGETAKVLGKIFGSEFEMSVSVSGLAKWG